MAASVNTTDVACRKLTVINPYSGAVLGEVPAASKEGGRCRGSYGCPGAKGLGRDACI